MVTCVQFVVNISGKSIKPTSSTSDSAFIRLVRLKKGKIVFFSRADLIELGSGRAAPLVPLTLATFLTILLLFFHQEARSKTLSRKCIRILFIHLKLFQSWSWSWFASCPRHFDFLIYLKYFLFLKKIGSCNQIPRAY